MKALRAVRTRPGVKKLNDDGAGTAKIEGLERAVREFDRQIDRREAELVDQQSALHDLRNRCRYRGRRSGRHWKRRIKVAHYPLSRSLY
jgi:hypothetical protein